MDLILQLIAVCLFSALVTAIGGMAFIVVGFVFRCILWIFTNE